MKGVRESHKGQRWILQAGREGEVDTAGSEGRRVAYGMGELPQSP